MTPPPYRPFRSVLVANRGEIALRIIRGLKEAGIRSIAVASEPDRFAPHALAADHCVVLGEGPAADSYLNADKVLAAARQTRAEAVHPGYGFFAENAAFASRVLDAGLVWIGPPPAAMHALGDKVRAKELARKAGVPMAASYEGDVADVETTAREAARVGFPLLVKAAAGGGGRGMRIVNGPDELRPALETASREAAAAFGSGRVFLERYVSPSRHVEIQVFGDAHGHVLHLGERECSVQRRHQKIVEWSPSTAVDAALRETMGACAVGLAKAAGYVGAGTVEFLLAPDGSFHFLEVNTRLQVEHPVTELVTGLDLLQLQLFTATGGALSAMQKPIQPSGHAIELRVCAEDPANQFAPQAGRILHLELPQGPGVRVDCGVRAGYEIPTHYDSLIAKLIVHAPSRTGAIHRALAALDDLVILGPVTNVEYLRAILRHPAFKSGELSTSFVAEHLAGWKPPAEVPDEVILAAAAAEMLGGGAAVKASTGAGSEPAAALTPWATLGPWRGVEDGK
jgi:acetyl/propionyl-CoA carboxylase alpha subunit